MRVLAERGTGAHPTLPIIGANTFRNPSGEPAVASLELARGTEQEKQSQLARLRDFHRKHAHTDEEALCRLQRAVVDGSNLFAELMSASRHCSLGQITETFFEVGGQYRRNV